MNLGDGVWVIWKTVLTSGIVLATFVYLFLKFDLSLLLDFDSGQDLKLGLHSPLSTREDWAELTFAKTSGIITGVAPVSDWPIVFPVPGKSPRSLCKSLVGPVFSSRFSSGECQFITRLKCSNKPVLFIQSQLLTGKSGKQAGMITNLL